MTTRQNPAEGRYRVEVHRDVRIPTADPAVTLSADVYLPAGAEQVPVLVSLIPYRKDMFGGRGYDHPFRWFAEHGYAGVLANLRGVGSSGGTQRPRLDTGEGDDGLAVLDWATGRPWCTGVAGMWGISYGGALTMRTASRRPPALRAIIPLACSLHPERYHGERGDLGLYARWGAQMLAEQLLPPVHRNGDPAEQLRWQQRIREREPLLLDMARHRPGDPGWSERVIDPSSVTAAALCVGGWQDIYPDAVTRFYEQLPGPKKLLVGPWVHTLPQDSPFVPVDFLPIALRWWDYWLRGIENGIMDDPPVTLYVLGHEPQWRNYGSWPPPTSSLALSMDGDHTLAAPRRDASPSAEAIAEYRSDPTTGALSGLGGETGGIGLPRDQHEDDCRAVMATGAPLTEDLLICGRPEVTVRLLAHANTSPRLVVRLTEVDPHGRSLLISSGHESVHSGAEVPGGREIHSLLRPTTYRVRRGNRLRIVLSDSDFPRLTPLPEAGLLRLAAVDLAIPVPAEQEGEPTELALIERDPRTADGVEDRWSITRDEVNDGIEVVIGGRGRGRSTDGRHELEQSTEARASVRRSAPDATVATGEHVLTAHLDTGERVTVTAYVRCTQTELVARGEIAVNEHVTYANVWESPLQRPVQAVSGDQD
ncbi:CocE/NonD family hydrolase [Sciscionella sediminilitoris]|uniref:CocE/NonD family hydrolase n=1 Tax=Sciscionella sediminilitoris TaxID=1445613 RepID=UPI00069073D7|nr:CocE/NonD family hydrolase [Sciscionella sp. SE31]